MRWIFKLVNDQKNFTQSFEEENKRIESLSSLIEFHVDKTQLSEAEAISSIKLWYSNCDEENEGCPMCKHYNVKTIQLKWGVNRYSFIHVFINTTAIKQFEIEKTRNDCLQLMFSSISHEFRTPLNAFSNSLLLLESNYKILLQKIDKFVSIELIPKLISQNQRETDECFYKIWKISTTSLMSLIEDILDLAKIEAGTFALNDQSFIVKILAQDIESIFLFQCTQKGLVFKIDAEQETLSSIVWSDIGRIKQVLMNLISNSLKFTQNGGNIFCC